MEEVFLNILNMSVAAAYMVIAVALIGIVIRKITYNRQEFLWTLVILRALCPLFKTEIIPIFPSEDFININVLRGAVPSITTAVPAIDNSVNSFLAEKSTDTAAAIITVLAAVWVIGLSAMVFSGVISYIRLKRRVAEAIPNNGVYECDIETPFVLGIVKPKIYVPFGTDNGYVLAHEKAHIKGLDHILKLLAFIALCVHWFDPLIWLAYILLSRDIEFRCDEAVIKDLSLEEKKEYCNALLEFSVKKETVFCPLSFGENCIKSRIKYILNYKPNGYIAMILCFFMILSARVLLTPRPEELSITHRVYECEEVIYTNDRYSEDLTEDDLPDIFITGGHELMICPSESAGWETIGKVKTERKREKYIDKIPPDDNRAIETVNYSELYTAGEWLIMELDGDVYAAECRDDCIQYIMKMKNAYDGE